jgi:monovalent cation:H+ antiporter-2, CPA2 family
MYETGLIGTLTVGLSAALVLGFVAQRLGCSPIVGYLLAGIAVGPYTPGIVADTPLARQLADVGVILLMFGVGLQFRLKDLFAVSSTVVPGVAVLFVSVTALAVFALMCCGWSVEAGLVLGLAVSATSTVVLTRALQEHKALDTVQGHVAVGWSVGDDMLTVLVLVLLPTLAIGIGADGSPANGFWLPPVIALLKVAVFAGLMIVAGSRGIPWVFTLVARSKSRELFTLSVLALALAIAVGASMLFGTSIALGAFLAGLVVGQSKVSHQAAADALPMRDAFAVLFFVSVGMLFDPLFVVSRPGLVLLVMTIILVVKPLIVMLMLGVRRYPARVVLSVAFMLSQIGEFSFIMAHLGQDMDILSDDGYAVIVACALFSIAVNPLLVRAVGPLDLWLKTGRLPRLLHRRSICAPGAKKPPLSEEDGPAALVVGYGPVGRTVTRILEQFGIRPVVIELNIDTVAGLVESGVAAIYGDAGKRTILQAAGILQARYLLITLPDLTSRIPVIVEARELNPDIKIFVRARYVAERAMLEELGATAVCYEEAEAAVALADLLLQEVGANEDEIRVEARAIRGEWALRG